MSDIKELKEALVALRILAVGGAKIAEDGFEAEDITDAVELVKRYQEIIDGFKGSDAIIEEIKDLDSAEAAEIFSFLIKAVTDVRAALKGEDVAL